MCKIADAIRGRSLFRILAGLLLVSAVGVSVVYEVKTNAPRIDGLDNLITFGSLLAAAFLEVYSLALPARVTAEGIGVELPGPRHFFRSLSVAFLLLAAVSILVRACMG